MALSFCKQLHLQAAELRGACSVADLQAAESRLTRSATAHLADSAAGSQVPRLRIKTSSQLEIGGVQGYILIWSRDRVAGKALREALGAPLGAVWATWTAPWTEWGARCCKT